MDKENILNSIINDGAKKDGFRNYEDGKSTDLSDNPKEEQYLKTFKGIRQQLLDICNDMRQKAYDDAYSKYLSKADVQLEFKRIESDLDSFQKGVIKQNPHAELREATIIQEATEFAEQAMSKATPKNPLSISIFLQKHIRFIRISPANRTQEAPLYFYHPDKGYYLENDELLKDLIQVIYPSMTKPQALDVLYKIAHASPLRKIMKDYTALGNCLFDQKTEKTEPFNPKIIVTRKVNTNWNDGVIEPNIRGWTPREWLLSLFDGDNELFDLAIQIIKACITGHPLKKLFWFYGEGGTGKGTLQQLIINLVGLENVASLKITGLNKSQFTTSILVGKSVVIGDDVQKDAVVKDTSDLFSLTTGDIMTIEEKGKKPYSLQLQMTVIQSSNGLPRMDGDKDAIDRRFRILPFSKTFKDNPNPKIKEDYINRQAVLEYILILSLTTPTKDINPKASQLILEEHQRDINPILAFIPTVFHEDLVSEFLPNSYVYYVYRAFLEYYGYTDPKKENAIHREIKNNLPLGYVVGQRIIPKSRTHHLGFYPREDQPSYVKLPYTNGREVTERQDKTKNERGYWKLKKD